MLKIAVVTPYFPSSAEPWQGRSAYQTLRVLAREADVHVFFPYAAYPSFLKTRSWRYGRLDHTYSPPEVKVDYYSFPALPLLSRPFNGWMTARVLLPHVHSFSPDLIFSFFVYPAGYAALKIARALGVPVVAMGIGSDIHSIGDRISAMHTRRVLREIDFLVTVSGDLRNRAIAMGAQPQTSRAIINGCDLSVFHPRDRREAREKLHMDAEAEAVVYIGRMDVKKGLRELVHAAISLRTERPRLHVFLVGEGPDRPEIEGAIRAGDAAGYVHLLPGCASDDVAVWMAAADLVTLPSYMEGCPNVVLEALACGRPVVATDVGGIPEILSAECGRLVAPRDAASLAMGLAEVLDSNWDAARISAHGSRSWNTVAAELMNIFESLVAKEQAAHAV
jgi:teichuronic acid biosynthesis glycosyltransferase TuaC